MLRSVLLAVLAAGMAAGSSWAQHARHPEPGFYIQAGGGVSFVEPYRVGTPGITPRPSFGAGAGWTSGRVQLSAHVERVSFHIDRPPQDVTVTYLALQPAWYVERRPYTGLYLGGRALLAWDHSVRTDTGAAGTLRGSGFGLVAGARSQMSRVAGFEVRAAGNFVWFEGVSAFDLQAHVGLLFTLF
jgi:hypothetical protein